MRYKLLIISPTLLHDRFMAANDGDDCPYVQATDPVEWPRLRFCSLRTSKGYKFGDSARRLCILQLPACKTKTHPPEISGGWVDTTRSWLDKCYSTISRAPDGYMPQQQQHVIRPVWQHNIMVECLYPTYAMRVNSRLAEKVTLMKDSLACNMQFR